MKLLHEQYKCNYVLCYTHSESSVLTNSYTYISPRFRQLCICLVFPRVVFVLIMLGHVTSSANGQLYTIKINQDVLMRLLRRGEYTHQIPRIEISRVYASKDLCYPVVLKILKC